MDTKTVFENQIKESIPLVKGKEIFYFDNKKAKIGEHLLFALLKLNNRDSLTFELITLNEKHFHLFKPMDEQPHKMLPQLIKL